MTDLVCKGDVRNRRWYVLAVVEQGDYTGVQRFQATPVVLQDEIPLLPELSFVQIKVIRSFERNCTRS